MPVNGTGTVAGGAHSSSPVESKEPIAIVGIGCRYPGASNVEELWENLLAGKDSIGPYPSGRFPGVDRAYESSQKKPGRLFTDAGGFLSNVDGFDSQFFEISPRESIYVDPQHRLLLEVAWEALEDAGQVRSTYEGSNAGVFVGLWTSEYETRLYESGSEADFYSITGCARASASGRVSFTFGLEGPSVTVDTACSSSLVAVHLACKSLWVGESEMALAGGANLILGPEISELFTKASMLSPDGRCKFGDASANGFVRSEGAGIVVLKRLSRARADGDRVYAVIRGGATNNDGRSSGLLVTPSRPGQRQMLLSAWKAAGIDPAMLRYIEAHGTGTGVGDPVEIGAIADALTAAGVKDSCALGSIKTNFGHTEAASGIAGLIKTALVLQHRTIPPSLHCKTPNPKIKWDRAPIQVATEAIDLQDEPGRLLAGVSSFGITGTNAHIVLEEVEQRVAARPDVGCPLVLPISARSPEALHELLGAYLKDVRVQAQKWPIHDLCYTASVRRNHHEFRTAIVCADFAELEERLAAAVDDEACDGVVSGRSSSARRRVVFVAPGQGSQWLGMARELYDKEPVFHQAFEECARAILAETGWSLTDRLLGEQAEQYLSEIDVIQPALFTMSVALAAVWKAWGVEPDAVVGHSMGEVAAAYLAGVLRLPDAVAVICRRSRLMKTLRSSGGMATVDLPLEETEVLLKGIPSLSVAASNGPRTTVISGDLKALERLLEELKSKEIYCRQVKVDVASHSSQVDPILDQLFQSLSEIAPQPARIPMVSTVTGEFALREGDAGTSMDASYWVRNLRQCVLLAPAVKRLCESGHDLFIELSPHPILIPSIESAAREVNPQVLTVPSLRREKPARATMLTSLAAMYVEGYAVGWEHFYPEHGRCVKLPQYPFQREHCWPEPGTTKRSDILDTMGNPLLGRQFTSSRQPQTILWESEISLAAIPYLTDHRVLRSAVFPASAYVEMALSGVRSLFPAQSFEVRKAAFLNAAYLPEEGNRIFQLAMSPEGAEAFSFEIRSRAEEGDASWTLHTTGQIHRGKEEDGEKPGQVSIPELQVAYEEVREGKDHYGRLAKSGLHYGPAFQVVERAWVGNLEALCQLRRDADEQSRYLIHPAILDGSFQAMALVFPTGDGFHPEDTYLPVSIEGVRMHQPIPETGQLFAHTFLVSSSPERGSFRVDLRLLDAEGSVLVEVVEMEIKRVAHQEQAASLPSLYTIHWVLGNAPGQLEIPKVATANWILFADNAGVAESMSASLEFAGGRSTTVRPGEAFRKLSSTKYEVRADSREDHERLFAEIGAAMGAPTAIVHLWTLDIAERRKTYTASELMGRQAVGSQHVPLLVQASAAANWQNPPRLWMVTAGSMTVGDHGAAPHIESAPMWGIGRAVAREYPELHATLVDLSELPTAAEARELARQISLNGGEDRIALRGQDQYVARLTAHTASNTESERLGDGEEYRFEIASAGVLDNLALRAFHPRPPGPGKIAIEVVASGLNFIDVAKSMGIYPGLDPAKPVGLGLECAGRVVAAGPGVTDFVPGDAVIAVAPSGQHSMLASQVTIPAKWAFKKPTRLSFDEAATVPITFLTAYYSLVELARAQRGDSVLIHAAAGGVGMAAVQIASWIGAKVIATVGSKEKEEYVRSLGVSHVFHSRSLDFGTGVMEATGGRGVDIVLNSLTGDFISRSFEVLAPYGRFVELGKRDIYEDRQIGLFPFRKNISFYAVDLAAALEERSEYVISLLQKILRHIEAGDWKPLPVTGFPAAEPSEPFRFMAQARHIGKIAIRMGRDVRALAATDRPLFLKDASYLITGGLGGIALKVAAWMAENGAGHLALVSRRAVNDEAAEAIRGIEAMGTSVQVIRADVTRESEVESVLSGIRSKGQVLKGIMHTAAVVDDGLIRDLSPERFRTVMAPKMGGTWNLHAATLHDKLDFFVLFSSIAAIHPQPGMGSYAAANAFLDAFSHYRQALGMPAISINWGGWNETGLARIAATERSIQDYVLQGMRYLSADEALEVLGQTIRSKPIQAVAVPFEWNKFAEFYDDHAAPLFAEFMSRVLVGSLTKSNRSEILDQVTGAESVERREEILESYLQEILSQVLKLAKRKIDRERPLGTMGLDSLMGLEFVRRLSKALEIAVPATVTFNYPTIRTLVPHLIQRLQLPLIDAPVQEETSHPSQGSDFAALPDDITEEDALEALMGRKGSRT
jgi:acyl transferase domain-containing protein/acyl carrier protein